jgi:hypothetical protein
MTWIEIHNPGPNRPALTAAMQAAMHGYPPEYGPDGQARAHWPESVRRDSIVQAHSLIPPVLEHLFSAFREMLSPALPLARRQHEMIATVVSVLNECHY